MKTYFLFKETNQEVAHDGGGGLWQWKTEVGGGKVAGYRLGMFYERDEKWHAARSDGGGLWWWKTWFVEARLLGGL